MSLLDEFAKGVILATQTDGTNPVKKEPYIPDQHVKIFFGTPENPADAKYEEWMREVYRRDRYASYSMTNYEFTMLENGNHALLVWFDIHPSKDPHDPREVDYEIP